MREALFHFVSHYGYIGLFSALMLGIVGLPVPDEILMAFAGYLISNGQLHFVLTIVFALAGSVVGMSISFYVGHRFGLPLIKKYGSKVHLTPQRLEKTEKWFLRIGKYAVTIGYFLPGVRHMTALLAGIGKWSFRTFLLYAIPGGVIWVVTFVLLGFFLGEHWQVFMETLHRYMRLIVVLLLAIGGLWGFVRFYLNKRRIKA